MMLIQSQHIIAARGIKVIIGIGDTRCNWFQRNRFAERVTLQELFQQSLLDGGIYGHFLTR